MSGVGVARANYAEQVEARPPRFIDPAAYTAWAARADEWARVTASLSHVTARAVALPSEAALAAINGHDAADYDVAVMLLEMPVSGDHVARQRAGVTLSPAERTELEAAAFYGTKVTR